MELRQSPRFPVQYPIAYSGNNIAGAGTVTNLSAGGCKVESYADVHSGMDLEVRIFMLGPDSPMVVDQAAVRWSAGKAFGLEFLTMRPDAQARLRLFISALEPGTTH